MDLDWNSALIALILQLVVDLVPPLCCSLWAKSVKANFYTRLIIHKTKCAFFLVFEVSKLKGVLFLPDDKSHSLFFLLVCMETTLATFYNARITFSNIEIQCNAQCIND